jgi:DNA-binding XRE family transcriptional regulator
MNIVDLTEGEFLFTVRKRFGMTQAAFAEMLLTTRKEIIRAEQDQATQPLSLDRDDVVCKKALEFHEQARILRRRAGMGRKELAERIGVSKWWLTQMESGVPGICNARLLEYWAHASN